MMTEQAIKELEDKYDERAAAYKQDAKEFLESEDYYNAIACLVMAIGFKEARITLRLVRLEV